MEPSKSFPTKRLVVTEENSGHMMKRSAGVTVIAILVLLGSALTLLLGVVVLIAMLVAPTPGLEKLPGPSFLPKVILAFVSLMYLVPAGIGIASGVGLLRLKNWARISTIVFSVVVVCISIFPAVLTLFMPFPTEPGTSLDPGTITVVRVVMSAFWFCLAAVGVWWLVFFTRRSVRQQFQPATLEKDQLLQEQVLPAQTVAAPVKTEPTRPASITVIASLLMAGSAFMLIGLVFMGVLQIPAIFFTKLITGWGAAVLYGTLGLAQFFIGRGLWRLRPAARTLALAYFTFSLLNIGVFYLGPGHQGRILAFVNAQTSMMRWMQPIGGYPEAQFHPAFFLIMGFVFGAVAIAVQMYFLFATKAAFQTAR